MSASITAIILTYNEQLHIERCLRSLQGVCDEVLVVDSFSTDDTVERAASMGARVVQHPWKNYATQLNYGIHECNVASDWLWRIDADEYLEGGIGEAVRAAIETAPDDVNGIYVRKRIDFMGRPLLHGGRYPSYHLKVWRRGHGECENRRMDEHIRIFNGKTVVVNKGNQVDANLNDLGRWTSKHNGYAVREMIDMLLMEYNLDTKGREVTPKLFGTEEQRKRWLKIRYIKAPLFVRPYINFLYRYVLRGGFLDGREEFIWHSLQGFRYRFLVDAKIYELRRNVGNDDTHVINYLKEKLCDNKPLKDIRRGIRLLRPERRRYAA